MTKMPLLSELRANLTFFGAPGYCRVCLAERGNDGSRGL